MLISHFCYECSVVAFPYSVDGFLALMIFYPYKPEKRLIIAEIEE
jgi:hypothetical protein